MPKSYFLIGPPACSPQSLLVSYTIDRRASTRGPAFLLGDALHGGRHPPAVPDLAAPGVEAHGQVEPALPGGQPVRLLLRAGGFLLDVQVERAVVVVFELVAVADGEALQRVRDLVALLVVKGHRPEGLGRGQLALVEMQHVAVRAAVGLPVAV